MPDLQIVVCAPVAPIAGIQWTPAMAPYSTYTQVQCPRCGQGMWLGQRGRAEVQAGRAEMICMGCAVLTGLLGPGDAMQRLTDRDP